MVSKEVGLMLYWCEGDKTTKGTWRVAITTSEPKMLKYFIDWLMKYYGVLKEKIKLRLHLWEGSDENQAKNQWSKKTGVKNFTKTWFKPKGKNMKFPYGICRASINSKRILNKILEEINKTFE
ncbi:MAG: hypothetical protein PHG04_00775 [Candidatus Nanoarchaeia archaeon]|nr:hypothetical protein [Candidatus Nanoarchaeia archaeon]